MTWEYEPSWLNQLARSLQRTAQYMRVYEAERTAAGRPSGGQYLEECEAELAMAKRWFSDGMDAASRDLQLLVDLDPDGAGTSTIMTSITSHIERLRQDWDQLPALKADDDAGPALVVTAELLDWLARITNAIRFLGYANAKFGISPADVEGLARRYNLHVSNGGLPSKQLLDDICERALLSKLRSDKALVRSKRVSDERVLDVLARIKGREAQAKELGFSAGSVVSRRLRDMRKEGIDVDAEIAKRKPSLRAVTK